MSSDEFDLDLRPDELRGRRGTVAQADRRRGAIAEPDCTAPICVGDTCDPDICGTA